MIQLDEENESNNRNDDEFGGEEGIELLSLQETKEMQEQERLTHILCR